MTSYGSLLFSNLSAFLMKRSRPNKRCFDLILHLPKTALTFTKIFSKCQICFAETRLKMACALARTRIRAKETSKSFVQLCGAGLGWYQTWQCNYLRLSVLGLLYCIIYSHTRSATPTAPTGFTSMRFSYSITTVFQGFSDPWLWYKRVHQQQSEVLEWLG